MFQLTLSAWKTFIGKVNNLLLYVNICFIYNGYLAHKRSVSCQKFQKFILQFASIVPEILLNNSNSVVTIVFRKWINNNISIFIIRQMGKLTRYSSEIKWFCSTLQLRIEVGKYFTIISMTSAATNRWLCCRNI